MSEEHGARREDASAAEAEEAAAESLAGQRERLGALTARERELGALRRREGELEVERIAAAAALGPRPDGTPAGLDADTAAALGEALEYRHELRESLAAAAPGGGAGAAGEPGGERLCEAREALAEWLEAPRGTRIPRLPPAVHWVLVAVCVAVIGAALATHLILLLLLLPVGGTLSLLWWTEQDLVWRRLGAQRRYRATGLEPPRAWDPDSVRARLAELDAAPAPAPSRPPAAAPAPGRDAGDERAALEAELAETESELDARLAETGLGGAPLAPDLEAWLRRAAEATRAQRDLDRVKAARRAARAEAERMRDGVFRYLAHHGEAPPGAQADSEALAAGLRRIAARGSNGGGGAGGER